MACTDILESVIKHTLSKVENLGGFLLEGAGVGQTVKVLFRAELTSDDPMFYKYVEQVSAAYFSTLDVHVENIFRFAVVIHQDLSADVFVNEFPLHISAQLKTKKNVGDQIYAGDFADISRLRLIGVGYSRFDKIICCFKVGWRFALFFDLATSGIESVDEVEESLGRLYRRLYFRHVYKTLESADQFSRLMRDGWFPFIEILYKEYKELSDAYENPHAIEAITNEIIRRFDRPRIDLISQRWWSDDIFAEKRPVLEAGVEAFLQNDESGNINCIKNLATELEGILRIHYERSQAPSGNISLNVLLNHIKNTGVRKVRDSDSLYLTEPFFEYLRDVIFARFDTASKRIPLSRHSTSHGVAKAHQYERRCALQFILSLDQLYFYIK